MGGFFYYFMKNLLCQNNDIFLVLFCCWNINVIMCSLGFLVFVIRMTMSAVCVSTSVLYTTGFATLAQCSWEERLTQTVHWATLTHYSGEERLTQTAHWATLTQCSGEERLTQTAHCKTDPIGLPAGSCMLSETRKPWRFVSLCVFLLKELCFCLSGIAYSVS